MADLTASSQLNMEAALPHEDFFPTFYFLA